jgi:ATP-dependent DNA helicase RecG
MLQSSQKVFSPWLDTSQFHSIDDLLAREEGQVLDFKSARIEPRDLAEVLVAFANSDGGTVVIGVENDKTITGTKRYHDNVQTLMRAPYDHCDPPVSVQIENLPCRNAAGEDDALLLLHIARGERVHNTSRRVAFLRLGDQDRRLSAEQVIQLAYDKGQADYEASPADGAHVEDLDAGLLERYRSTIGARGDFISILTARELAEPQNGEPNINIAGALLFASRPQHWHPRCGIRVIKYEGTEPRTGAQMNIVKDRIFEAPLPKLLDQTFDLMATLLREFTRLWPNGKFVTTPEYPPFVWQEAVTNAVVHRSYTNRGRQTEVFIFDDRLEVISPGEFPGSIRAATIRGSHFSRNPRIARVMAELEYIRDLGEGVDRMFREMEEGNLPSPVFEEITGAVRLVLYNGLGKQTMPAQKVLAPELMMRLNERQRKVLEYIAQKGSIASREYQQLFSVGSTTAYRDLSALVEVGLIRVEGERRSVRYLLKVE